MLSWWRLSLQKIPNGVIFNPVYKPATRTEKVNEQGLRVYRKTYTPAIKNKDDRTEEEWWEYNEAGQATSYKCSRGFQWVKEYDKDGNLVLEKTSGGYHKQLVYENGIKKQCIMTHNY
jgi:YD repeat-containing protein